MQKALVAMVSSILLPLGTQTASAIQWAESVVDFTNHPDANFAWGIDYNGDGFSENGVDVFSPDGGHPELALGPPDGSYVSINQGEFVVYAFASPILDVAGFDLFVFETGGSGESIRVSVSADGIGFEEVGTVTQPADGNNVTPFGDVFGLDLSAIQGPVRYVMLDQIVQGGLGGFDLTAIGAVPEPSTVLLLAMGLVGVARWRRR